MYRLAAVICLLGATVLAPVGATPRLEQVHPARAAVNGLERAALLTGEDRQTIDGFFRRNPGHAPTARRDTPRDPLLIRDHLPRNARLRPLPEDLDERLRPLPSGYDRVILGRDVVVVELRSRLVLDIMRQVVR